MCRGFKPYAVVEHVIAKMYPGTVKNEYPKDWNFLFGKYPALTLREFAELAEVPMEETQHTLYQLSAQKDTSRILIMFGYFAALSMTNSQG